MRIVRYLTAVVLVASVIAPIPAGAAGIGPCLVTADPAGDVRRDSSLLPQEVAAPGADIRHVSMTVTPSDLHVSVGFEDLRPAMASRGVDVVATWEVRDHVHVLGAVWDGSGWSFRHDEVIPGEASRQGPVVGSTDASAVTFTVPLSAFPSSREVLEDIGVLATTSGGRTLDAPIVTSLSTDDRASDLAPESPFGTSFRLDGVFCASSEPPAQPAVMCEIATDALGDV